MTLNLISDEWDPISLQQRSVRSDWTGVLIEIFLRLVKLKINPSSPEFFYKTFFFVNTSFALHCIANLEVRKLGQHISETNCCAYVVQLTRTANISGPTSTGFSIFIISCFYGFLFLSPVYAFVFQAVNPTRRHRYYVTGIVLSRLPCTNYECFNQLCLQLQTVLPP